MVIFRKAAALSEYISQQKEKGFTIGFVPTMGALHAGHLSLVDAALQQASLVVSSIFVNPTQFNNKEDLAKYPVTIERDIKVLESSGCHILFLPSEVEIYSKDYFHTHYDIGELGNLLEGKYRPGHFQGVCQVVDKLLDIVQPNSIFLGQKDYQQSLVIKKLLQLTRRATIMHVIPTMREASGLAMSSRNLRLSPEQKERATIISEVLNYLKENIHEGNHAQLSSNAEKKLTDAGFVVDYVSIVDAETLLPPHNINETLVAVIAATLGGIRLIDNEVLNNP